MAKRKEILQLYKEIYIPVCGEKKKNMFTNIHFWVQDVVPEG